MQCHLGTNIIDGVGEKVYCYLNKEVNNNVEEIIWPCLIFFDFEKDLDIKLKQN